MSDSSLNDQGLQWLLFIVSARLYQNRNTVYLGSWNNRTFYYVTSCRSLLIWAICCRLYTKILQKLGRVLFWLLIYIFSMKSHLLMWIWNRIGVFTTNVSWNSHQLTRFVDYEGCAISLNIAVMSLAFLMAPMVSAGLITYNIFWDFPFYIIWEMPESRQWVTELEYQNPSWCAWLMVHQLCNNVLVFALEVARPRKAKTRHLGTNPSGIVLTEPSLQLTRCCECANASMLPLCSQNWFRYRSIQCTLFLVCPHVLISQELWVVCALTWSDCLSAFVSKLLF